jgi:hypothetical protein
MSRATVIASRARPSTCPPAYTEPQRFAVPEARIHSTQEAFRMSAVNTLAARLRTRSA